MESSTLGEKKTNNKRGKVMKTGNFEDLPEKDQMEIALKIANEGLPEKMWIATLHGGEKIYKVNMIVFEWQDQGPGEAGVGVWPVLSYWDGSNRKLDFLESAPVEIEYEPAETQPEDPEPAYYEIERIEINGEEINIVSSNVRGSITPYWTEEKCGGGRL